MFCDRALIWVVPGIPTEFIAGIHEPGCPQWGLIVNLTYLSADAANGDIAPEQVCLSY